MTTIYNTQILSGLALQQQYRTDAVSKVDASGSSERTPSRLFEDTVDISPQARELFHAQNDTTDGSASLEKDKSTNQSTDGADAEMDETQETSEQDSEASTISDKIDALESEISSLESEIAALEEEAQTDDVAAALLRSKKAHLKTAEATLTGLKAKASNFSD